MGLNVTQHSKSLSKGHGTDIVVVANHELDECGDDGVEKSRTGHWIARDENGPFVQSGKHGIVRVVEAEVDLLASKMHEQWVIWIRGIDRQEEGWRAEQRHHAENLAPHLSLAL